MFASLIAPILFRPLAYSAADVGTPAATTETVLKTYTVPANMLNVNGKRIRAYFWGRFALNANNKTVRVRFGPVTLTGTILLTTTTSPFNNTGWMVMVDIVRGGVDQQVGNSSWHEDGATAANMSVISEVAVTNDDGAANLLELTGQNGTASANDIICSSHRVEWINNP